MSRKTNNTNKTHTKQNKQIDKKTNRKKQPKYFLIFEVYIVMFMDKNIRLTIKF